MRGILLRYSSYKVVDFDIKRLQRKKDIMSHSLNLSIYQCLSFSSIANKSFQLALMSLLIYTRLLTLIVSELKSFTLFHILLGRYSFASMFYIFHYSWIYLFYISPLLVVPTIPGFPLWGHIYIIFDGEDCVQRI